MVKGIRAFGGLNDYWMLVVVVGLKGPPGGISRQPKAKPEVN